MQFPGLRIDEIPIPFILGNHQAFIPNISPEDIRKILHRNEPKSVEPAFQKVEAHGKVEGQIAKVRIEFSFTTEHEPEISFPLGFREGAFLNPETVKKTHGENASEADSSEDDEQIHYEGKGTCELTVDGQSGDYVLKIRNPEPSEDQSDSSTPQKLSHKFTFTLAFSVSTFGKGDQRLKMTFPPAVRSRFVLSLPIDDAVPAEAPQGVNIMPSITPLPEGGTVFEMHGLSKTIDLSWREQPRVNAVEKPVTLQVEGARILVRINPGEMEYEANLPVRAIGGPLRRFQVRLPEGTRYVPELSATQITTDYQIEEVHEEEPLAASPSELPETEPAVGSVTKKGPLLELRVQGTLKQETPLPIQIRAVRTLSPEEQLEANELGGFEVLGAERQSGVLEIEVPDEDLRPSWKSNRGIRIDEDSDISLQEKTRLRFVYFTQPFSLFVKVVSPQTQISVKPEYRIDIEHGQILLKGKMSATIRGAKTYMLQLHLYDWTLDEVQPGTIDVSAISRVHGPGEENPRNTINLPLRVRTDGPFEWSFTAFRPMPQFDENQKTKIHFNLPIPVAERIEPAQIVIAPADNVELPEETQKLTGLTRTARSAIPSELLLPARQHEPLCLRSDVPLDAAKTRLGFESDLIVHKQEVYVTSRSNVRLRFDHEDHVVQNLTYDVRFEPLDRVSLLVPKPISESGTLKISFAGKEIEPWRISYPDPIGPELTRLNISLPNRLIGRETFTLHYKLEPVEAQRQSTTLVTVPLIVPGKELPFLQQQVAVSTRGGINIIYTDTPNDTGNGRDSGGVTKIPHSVERFQDDSASEEIPENGDTETAEENASETPAKPENPWTKLDKETLTSDSALQESVFVSTRWENAITLYVLLDSMDVLGNTVVERAWVQTWLTTRKRVDRAAFRITSHHESFSVSLPSGFEKNHLNVQWANKTIPLQNLQYDADGALLITQTPEQRSYPHLLDIRYEMPGQSIRNLLEIELPHFPEGVWVKRMYWQVILPQNRHLIGDSPDWTPEFHWVWNKLFWNRESAMTQEEMELWIGSNENQIMNVSKETSRYLFSSFNPPQTCTLTVVNRTEIVLFCSGVVLLIGLALIYFPWTRYLGVVFSLGVLLSAILLYHSTSALLILQASVLGVILTLVAGILARVFHQDPQWKFAPIVPVTQNSATKVEKKTSPSVPLEVIIDTSQRTHILPQDDPNDAS